jgi:hypothetical protein
MCDAFCDEVGGLPFWLDQIRTTLRALIHWYTYSSDFYL